MLAGLRHEFYKIFEIKDPLRNSNVTIFVVVFYFFMSYQQIQNKKPTQKRRARNCNIHFNCRCGFRRKDQNNKIDRTFSG